MPAHCATMPLQQSLSHRAGWQKQMPPQPATGSSTCAHRGPANQSRSWPRRPSTPSPPRGSRT
eukprot:11189133-Lingulodinium_polyedra.AAC.1